MCQTIPLIFIFVKVMVTSKVRRHFHSSEVLRGLFILDNIRYIVHLCVL